MKRKFLITFEELDALTLKVSPPYPREMLIMSTGSTVFLLRDDEQFDLTFEADDKAGNKVPLDDSVTIVVSSSDELILTVTYDAVAAKATVVSTGKLGTAQINVKATIAGNDLTGSLIVEIVAGVADHLTLIPSAPISKP